MWKKQFGVYLDDEGLWRCRGRLENAALPIAARHPVLLPKHHSLTVLVIREAHERLMHDGVRETLAEIRSKYWINQRRQVVQQVLSRCVICRQYEGLPQCAPQPPPLPQFRVTENSAFTYVGVDFVGPQESRANCREEGMDMFVYLLCSVSSTFKPSAKFNSRCLSSVL